MNYKNIGAEEAMDNAYLVISGKRSISELLSIGLHGALPFNPCDVTLDELMIVIDNLIEHYIILEEYEKCSELKAIKEKI